MNQSYNLLKHRTFSSCIKKFLDSFPDSEKEKAKKQLIVALQKIIASPTECKPLQDLSNPKLHGIVRRTYVGGNQNRRLIFIFPHRQNHIIPFYISDEKRADFDYDEHIKEIETIAEEISQDYSRKNYAAFENWKA